MPFPDWTPPLGSMKGLLRADKGGANLLLKACWAQGAPSWGVLGGSSKAEAQAGEVGWSWVVREEIKAGLRALSSAQGHYAGAIRKDGPSPRGLGSVAAGSTSDSPNAGILSHRVLGKERTLELLTSGRLGPLHSTGVQNHTPALLQMHCGLSKPLDCSVPQFPPR